MLLVKTLILRVTGLTLTLRILRRYGIIFIWKLSNGLVSGFYDFEFHEDPR